MPTPYEKEMERLRALLDEVESEEDALSDNEICSDLEIMSEHDSESELELYDDSDEKELILHNQDFIGKDKCTSWAREKFKTNGRTRAKNIISHLPGPRLAGKNAETPNEAWDVFINKDIINEIILSTNIFIQKISPEYSRARDAKKTDEIEIRAVFGLLYLSGLHKSSHLNVRDLWATDGTGIEMFPATMSYKRFLFLLRCLRFDNINTREERQKEDKLAAIRNIFETFVKLCRDSYCVGEYVTIDEKLLPFRGRCGFRQYIPNKPAKYGIKIFALVDSRTFYTSDMEIYAGNQPEGQFQKSNKPLDIVTRLMQPLYKTGRNLTTDNWCTSYPLAKHLLSEKITLVGTLRKDKREIPPEFTVAKGREVNSSVFAFQKDLTAVSYIPKKGKCVILLSSMHNDDAIDESTGDKRKPEIISFYNLTKGAVDVVDEMEANYSTARITNRWPMVIFYSMLNIAAINARIILLSTQKPPLQYRSRRLFLKDLALHLIKPNIERRSRQVGLPQDCRKRCLNVCSKDDPTSKKTKTAVNSKGRCYICPRNKDKKSSTACLKCNQFLCKEHTLNLCKSCIDKED